MARPDPNLFVRDVARRIAYARREAGLTQAEAAERFGCALRGWQRIEGGLNITLHTAARIAAALGIDPWELLRPNPELPAGTTKGAPAPSARRHGPIKRRSPRKPKRTVR